MPSSCPRPPLTPISWPLPPQEPSGHAPPPPQPSLLRPGSTQGCGTAPTTQTPSRGSCDPTDDCSQPEAPQSETGNMCPAEYPLAAASGCHGGPCRPSHMNQEADGMGAAWQGAGWGHPAGEGGSEQGEPANRTAAGGLQQGRGLTPGQLPHPGQPPPAEPLASSPHLLNAPSQDQGTRGSILVRAQPHSRGTSAFRVLS